MTARKFNAADPGDPDIEQAWRQWQIALSHIGASELYARQAAEWREMYLGLLARKDRNKQEDQEKQA